MKTLSCIAFLLACSLAFTAQPATAVAGTRSVVVPPKALSPLITNQSGERMGTYTIGQGTDAYYWSVLKLPLGARISGLSYRRLGWGSSETVVSVDRVQPGRTPAWQRIFDAPDTQVSPPDSTGHMVTGTATGVSRTVAAGWTYFVSVKCASGAGVGDITVKYVAP